MKSKMFGTLVAGAVAGLVTGAAQAQAKKDPHAKDHKAAAKGEMVHCYSESCAGKLEHAGQKNTCGGEAHAMEMPAADCTKAKGKVKKG